MESRVGRPLLKPSCGLSSCHIKPLCTQGHLSPPVSKQKEKSQSLLWTTRPPSLAESLSLHFPGGWGNSESQRGWTDLRDLVTGGWGGVRRARILSCPLTMLPAGWVGIKSWKGPFQPGSHGLKGLASSPALGLLRPCYFLLVELTVGGRNGDTVGAERGMEPCGAPCDWAAWGGI